jgi:carbon monoxide dehydrogenase subunit G
VELINEFRVAVPIDEAWAVLTDVERIAPCLPGAQLQEIDGDEHRGLVKVKVGPITAQYKGAATFVEQDAVSHRVVLRAEGRDTRGQGNASATVTATMEADGDGTTVKVVTDLTVTGKVAQFGRGVLGDVSAKLIGQFVDNLERDVLRAPTSDAAAPVVPEPAPVPAAASNGAAAEPAPTVRRIDHPDAEPVDLLAHAGTPVLKRALPPLVVTLVVVVLWRVRMRRRRSR